MVVARLLLLLLLLLLVLSYMKTGSVSCFRKYRID
jgi:hypothetical protein